MPDSFDLARTLRDIEDLLVPSLQLRAGERALYYHLFRHSRLDGARRVHLSNRSLARRFGTSAPTVRFHLQHLTEKGCVRILDRGPTGHFLEVLLPGEIPGCSSAASLPDRALLERADCLRDARLRSAILRREQNACFYCLRQLPPEDAVLDHAVPVAAGGDNSYRNIVASCFDCNTRKKDRPADVFLRELYRSARLSSAELDARLAALDSLLAGDLIPH